MVWSRAQNAMYSSTKDLFDRVAKQQILERRKSRLEYRRILYITQSSPLPEEADNLKEHREKYSKFQVGESEQRNNRTRIRLGCVLVLW